ncbi:MAG: hypothetical protein QNJ34_08240 [Xenococcaceae cyanobacterium MO_188.B29]|nr:hypothetical protein [Xenococcaceae cyanobacterium MO_188.B29]
MKRIIQKLEQKIGIPGLVDRIAVNLSGSELNTFLLDLFSKKTKQITPPVLLQQYRQNRFSSPASIDPIKYKEDEIFWLKSGESKGFKPLLLSPLIPLGSSSVVGYVDQNNVISALRGSEVVSDATNALALKIASEIGKEQKVAVKQYCATHRYVRGQNYKNTAFSAHFGAFCLVSGGIDRSNHSFEVELAKTHISFYLDMLLSFFAKENLSLEVYLADNSNTISKQIEEAIRLICQSLQVELRAKDPANNYYQILQFKIFLSYKNGQIDLADGGFVDWTQKMLANNKQRLFISGVGLEIIHKIKQEML